MLSSLSPAEHERLSRFGALAVAAVAAAACLYFIVRTAWLFVPHGEPPPPAVAVAGGPAAPELSVAKWHLFGSGGPAQPVATAPLATVLKLGLRGTLALPDAGDPRAMAIIANEAGVEASYRVGDVVAPSAKLSEVYADHVVIDHQGVAETLNLPRPEQHALPDTARRAASAPGASSVPPGIRRADPGQAPMPAAAASAAAAAPFDARELASQIRPVFGSDGKLAGANISGADPALLARVGLRPSDVVTAINGTPLAGVADPQALMNQLQGATSIQVTVQRDGRPATLTLSLR